MIDSTRRVVSTRGDWETLPYLKDWETGWKLQGPMKPIMRVARESTKVEADAISL